jgi:hypothetical protein
MKFLKVFNPIGDTYSISTIAYIIFLRLKHCNELVFCHQCKSRKESVLTITCDQGHKYCSSCFWNRYGILVVDIMKYKKFNCPTCNNWCNCKRCRTSDDKLKYDVTEIMRSRDYLQKHLIIDQLDLKPWDKTFFNRQNNAYLKKLIKDQDCIYLTI